MNSSLYMGEVRHRRFVPRSHKFNYSLFMVYLDLAELDTVFRGRWLWSTKHPALAWFRRRDHFGDPAIPLDTCVRDRVEQQTGQRPQGAIRLLTHLRYSGYCFNPISIYYCFAPDGETLEALVAEVSNTPWGERICYVLDVTAQTGGRQSAEFDKAMFVSPFMPMGLRYSWHSTTPSEHLAVHLNVLKDRLRMLDATLSLRRQPINSRNLAGVLLRFPFMTLQVIIGIHWQALRLWLKRIPLFSHSPLSKSAEG